VVVGAFIITAASIVMVVFDKEVVTGNTCSVLGVVHFVKGIFLLQDFLVCFLS
jgi:hypothetical protein